MVAEPGFEPGSPAYEAGGVPGLPYPAIETKCARWELNPQPIGYQPIAPTVVLLAHIEVETTLSSRPFNPSPPGDPTSAKASSSQEIKPSQARTSPSNASTTFARLDW